MEIGEIDSMLTTTETQVAADVGERTILRTVSAYCIQWNIYAPAGKFGELKGRQFCFLPGCFDESLKGTHEITLARDCEHQPIYARRSDGTLRITSDDIGLKIEADLLDTPECRELIRTIDAGKCRGWSHVWRPINFGWRLRRESGLKFFDHYHSHLSEIAVVISKIPRHRKSTPLFNYGGPSHVSTYAVPLT